MGCKWCAADLDWRKEDGKNVPYDKGTNNKHNCPKGPNSTNPSPAVSNTTTSSQPTSKPDPPRSDIVIVGNLSDQVKAQIGTIVEERIRKVLKEGLFGK